MRKVEEVHELTLRAAARSGDPVLAEIVREVRAGRLTLRDAVASPAYHDTFAEAADKVLVTLRDLGPVDPNESSAEQRLDDLVEGLSEWDEQLAGEAEPAGTATVADKAGVETTDDAYFDGKSFMVTGSDADRTSEPNATPQRERWRRRWS